MGMSTHVIGIRPADDNHRKMLAACRACDDAGVGRPDEVDDYFDGLILGDDETIGLHVDLDEPVAREYQGDCESGYEVDIDKLPKGIKTIRFVNSW